ncbi:DNA-binding response regulator [Chelativorans xinjiangense]|uniref:response regulator transcription factor n=1 Tax=Chelativorans xinjiangense TaxID=2681485 RepID=UPI001356FED8|nr:DNA-binding response regulator [Chelativorans xinjiangense]
MGVSAASSAPPVVLVVDDSPDALGMLTDALGLEGMKVVVATSGRAALNIAQEIGPDIILMDAKMPGIDGFETCRILKTEMGMADIPIIFMTGFGESEHVVNALASGGVDFVVKPVPIVELLARMRVHLANARRARSARQALDSTGRRIVVTDNRGTLLWATPQASELLLKCGVAVEEGGRLPWEVTDWLLSQKPGRTEPYILSRNGKKVECRIVGGAGGAERLIRLIDREAGTDEERLATAFDLSLRAAEVLLWITHGKSNKEIAEILDLSPRTVNKHLEQIFNKLGVENRTAAATMSVRVLWDR